MGVDLDGQASLAATDRAGLGRHHPVPRLTMFLAEEEVTYRYSGTRHVGEGLSLIHI